MTPKTVITDRPVLALDVRAEPGDVGAFEQALALLDSAEMIMLPPSAELTIVELAAPEEIRVKVSSTKTAESPSTGEPDQ